jgi:putative transposase
MPRAPRIDVAGIAYHTLNRAQGRHVLFQNESDFAAFERVLQEALTREAVRILAYCVMPNHWHLVLWPERDGAVSAFIQWLSMTHTQRWHAYHKSAGTGHVYQGRYKSFPVREDEHLIAVCRYVERNPLDAGLVRRAEDWRWSSLWRRERGGPESSALLGPWPFPHPENWIEFVNRPLNEEELEVLRSLARGGRQRQRGQEPYT